MPVYIFTLAILRTPNLSTLFLLTHNTSMAMSIIDFEQRKLLRGFASPTSQLDTASLHNKEARLACGRSRDTAIWIFSDVESDTEDEDDASQPYSAQPYTIHLTTTEHSATESGAAVTGEDTASPVSSTQEEAVPAWSQEPKVSRLANDESIQQSCEMNHLLIGDKSACQDVNFAIPPGSPASQPHPVAGDGKLRPETASQQSNTMLDTVSEHDTAGSVEVIEASLQENKIPAGNLYEDTAPEARSPCPAKSWDEPCQGQALCDTSSASAQPKNGDACSEVPGSEDSIDRLGFQHRDENPLSLPDDENSQSEDNDSDDIHQGQKRRRVSKSTSCSARSATTSSQSARSSHKHQPAVHAPQLPSDVRTSGGDMHSPTPLQAIPAPSEAQMAPIRFEEWPLTDVFLKRITEESGKTTFQLQFEWNPDSCQLHAAKSASLPTKRKRLPSTLHSASKSSSRRRSSQDNCFTPVLDSIRVAVDGMSDASNDDDSSNSSNFEDDSDRDRASRPHTFHCKKTKRRRWTTEEEDLLRQLKQSQQGNGMLSEEIAMKLDRTESSVKQHWDVMGRKQG
ncbi:hypothetical protein H9Q72_007596 [Fusarium xylarioides]|uniref:Myb-like domain-containing protein n=1 Tax=Fusarium xylarioides TaxID=221167 RepID=A0A9P7HPJ0_9HYPO|nr:hypothetical protein H9Q72_007596 [Fusarium xylarioides]